LQAATDIVYSEDSEGEEANGEGKSGKPEVDQFGKRKIKGRMVSFFSLLKFSTRKDKLLMIIGTVGSLIAGVALPFFAVIFGTMVNDFGPTATP
jgi:hypothetical protein